MILKTEFGSRRFLPCWEIVKNMISKNTAKAVGGCPLWHNFPCLFSLDLVNGYKCNVIGKEEQITCFSAGFSLLCFTA